MQKKFKITVDGREYDVTVEDLSEGTSYLLPQPGDMKIPAPEAKPQAPPPAPPAASGHGTNDLLSPLAGVISSLSVSQGQSVAQGQDVAVIEAMKMKTTLVAHRAGAVVDVAVQVKDAVEAGQRMMTIE
ncbi:acetyl-CoA carboxylase biotin carboxyl carrier protein subunit [Gammaproteobacteria bacterium]|nr:acetyl-CoA carboxylase biotin carboxyl carrier protein subunit [Gammaproteobacteria bacterium]